MATRKPPTPVTLYVEEDLELGAAFTFLENAVVRLKRFRDRYPERVDTTDVGSVLDHVQIAHGLLDGDFYTEGNADPNYGSARVVAVLEVDDAQAEGLDRTLIESVPAIKGVVLIRDSSPDVERYLETEPQVGETAQAAAEDAYTAQARPANQAQVEPIWEVKATVNPERLEQRLHTVESRLGEESVAPTLEERLTDETFFDREPGSVLGDEYAARLADVQNAANYLRNEMVFRVEYNQRWGQVPKVNWVEASSEAEASWVPKGVGGMAPVTVVSCRRATEEDIPEYVRQVAAEEGW